MRRQYEDHREALRAGAEQCDGGSEAGRLRRGEFEQPCDVNGHPRRISSSDVARASAMAKPADRALVESPRGDESDGRLELVAAERLCHKGKGTR
jgi:hypothetical protein